MEIIKQLMELLIGFMKKNLVLYAHLIGVQTHQSSFICVLTNQMSLFFQWIFMEKIFINFPINLDTRKQERKILKLLYIDLL